MVLSDVMAVFFVIAGLMVAFPGLWLFCRALWPEFHEACAKDSARNLFVPFLIGLPIIVGVVFALSQLGKLGSPGGIALVLLVCVYLLFAQVGVSGLATHIGQRLFSPGDKDRPWKATLRGGIVLVLSYLLPPVGVFLILPFTIIAGAGISIRTLIGGFLKRRKLNALKRQEVKQPLPPSNDPSEPSGSQPLGAST